MERTLIRKKILAFSLGMGILIAANFAWACKLHPKRYYQNQVNTVSERRFDRNHNGYLDWYEARRMAVSRVDRGREWRCDYNRNGYIDTAHERSCL